MSTTLPSFPRLLGDVGGTNARLAVINALGEPIRHVCHLPTRDFPSLQTAIEHYLADLAAQGALTHRPRWASLGIASPIVGDEVRMMNHDWSFSMQGLKQSLGLDRLCCLNDFNALAWGLPALKPDHLVQIGGHHAEPGRSLALLGAGTGLGTSGLIPVPGQPGDLKPRWTALVAEGGHVTLPARDQRELAVLGVLRRRWDHVSAERVLSGAGLVRLYEAVCVLQKEMPQPLAPADVTERGISGQCQYCAEAIDLFCHFLGTVASDLALSLGALGGVYIGGGIVPKLGEVFVRSGFRERFEDKGRYRDYLGPVPVYVIHDPHAALLGAAMALDLLPEMG